MNVGQGAKRLVRGTLAAVGLFLALFLFAGVVQEIAPIHYASTVLTLALVGNAFFALVGAIWFVRKSCSLERLWAFVLAVFAIWFPLGLLYSLFESYLYRTGLLNDTATTIIEIGLAILIYGIAYLFVYQGGYARLKSWT